MEHLHAEMREVLGEDDDIRLRYQHPPICCQAEVCDQKIQIYFPLIMMYYYILCTFFASLKLEGHWGTLELELGVLDSNASLNDCTILHLLNWGSGEVHLIVHDEKWVVILQYVVIQGDAIEVLLKQTLQ